MEMNQTFNTIPQEDPIRFFKKFINANIIMNSVMLPLGAVLNAWMLLAVATSTALRGRMRNKIIISFCIQHLLECVVYLPLNININISYFYQLYSSCQKLNALFHVFLMQDFIMNWTLFILVAVYLAQVCDFRVESRLPVMPSFRGACAALTTPRLATFTLLATPWILSCIIFPPVILIPQTVMTFVDDGICFASVKDEYFVFKCVDTAVPLILTFSLLVFTVVFKRRRQSVKGIAGDEMRAVLVESVEDSGYPYAAALFVFGICEIGLALGFIGIYEINFMTRFIFDIVSLMVSECKVVLIIFPWLLFPDIRERIKTWRPWCCERPSPA